jgi:hypothetical protein
MPPPAEPEDELLVEDIGWQEATVQSIITAKGRLIHTGIGVAEQDWIYTEGDLAELVPATTRLLNRYIPHLAKYADPAVVVAALMNYATRSLGERRAVMAAQEGDGGTREIPPAQEAEAGFATAAPTQTPAAPAAQPPRAAASFPTPATAPAPAEGDQPAPPPAPAPVDPEAVEWEVGA